jgi:hypothetical protein
VKVAINQSMESYEVLNIQINQLFVSFFLWMETIVERRWKYLRREKYWISNASWHSKSQLKCHFISWKIVLQNRHKHLFLFLEFYWQIFWSTCGMFDSVLFDNSNPRGFVRQPSKFVIFDSDFVRLIRPKNWVEQSNIRT